MCKEKCKQKISLDRKKSFVEREDVFRRCSITISAIL